MSCKASETPSFKLQPNTVYETTELYEQVNTPQPAQSRPTQEMSKRYESTADLQTGPSTLRPSFTTPAATVVQPAKSRAKAAILIALTTTLLLCLLVVSLVAVILYSPQMRTSSESAARTDSQDNLLLSPLHNLTAVQATIDQLSSSVTILTSQLVSMQNLVQSITSVQNNLRDDLNRLRSVDLYQNCIQDTRTCTMSIGSTSYYWRSCTTSSIYINPTVSYLCMWFKLTLLSCTQYSPQDTQYYTVDIRCDYSTNYGYIESSTLYKNANNYYSCYCDVTRLSSYTSSSHATLSSSFSSTCTLTVTRCPRSLNLLS